MLVRLLLLFTLVPIAELAVLVQLGEAIGLGATLLLIFATGVVGAGLARREGARSWWEVRRRLSRGELPARELLGGLMILVAGAFLVTPGVLTDAAGFLLLVRPVRGRLAAVARGWLERRVEADRTGVDVGDRGARWFWFSGPGSTARDMQERDDGNDGDEEPGTEGGGRVIEM